MTIARRRTTSLNVIAAPMPNAPSVRPPAPEVGVTVPFGDAPAPESLAPVGRLRRCTFRRIDRVEALPGRSATVDYEAMCLYGDQDKPLSLGDLAAAQTVCDTCRASGIFRPDED